MPKKEHPKARRQKAAELLEKAKEEEAKRCTKIGEMFAARFLKGTPKNGGTLDEFIPKAAKIYNQKASSPKEMRVVAAKMIKEAELDEAGRKQMIGEQLLQALKNMPQGEQGLEKMKQIKVMATKIWQD